MHGMRDAVNNRRVIYTGPSENLGRKDRIEQPFWESSRGWGVGNL